MKPMRLVLCLCLLLCGCHGQLVQALEERNASSCIYWSGPLGHGVTATGGVPIERCLDDPCRGR